MSSEGWVRRSRLLPRPELPPGPLATLKSGIYALYLEACPVTLDELRDRIELLDEVSARNPAATMDAIPNKDTIRDVISGARLPSIQHATAVVTALLTRRHTRAELESSAVRNNPELAQIRRLWRQAATVRPAGRPIMGFLPRDLEVHGETTDAELPPYIEREHDPALHRAVTDALAGRSGIVILISDSTSGKTRACYQAMHWTPTNPPGKNLADQGWQLWPTPAPRRPGGDAARAP